MWRERAIRRIRDVSSPSNNGLAQCIEAAASFHGSDSVFRRITQAKDTETILDYFAEIRFAMIFARLGFELEFEPCGMKGPDLRISRDSCSAHVEVKRFRPSPDDENPAYSAEVEPLVCCPMLLPYGNPEKNIKVIEDKLAEKFKQLNADTAVVAFWSDRLAVEELEFQSAILHTRANSEAGIQQIPAGLLFALFGSDWLNACGQQLYSESLQTLSEPFATWAEELRNGKASVPP